MDKEQNKIMEELSLAVFGKRYEWRKLTRKGLRTGQQGVAVRRMPLTIEGAKHYMETTLEMRKKMEEDKNGQ